MTFYDSQNSKILPIPPFHVSRDTIQPPPPIIEKNDGTEPDIWSRKENKETVCGGAVGGKVCRVEVLGWQTTLNRTWLFSINQSQVQWRERFFYRLCNEASATNGSRLSASLISAKVPDRGMGTAISVLIHRLAWESHCCFPSLKRICLNRNFSIIAQLIRSVGDDEEFHWILILLRATHVRARARRSEWQQQCYWTISIEKLILIETSKQSQQIEASKFIFARRRESSSGGGFVFETVIELIERHRRDSFVVLRSSMFSIRHFAPFQEV